MSITRRQLIAGAITAMALPVTACSSGAKPQTASDQPSSSGPSSSGSSFPVTIRHAFGATTIEAPPTRVATVSWVNADVALALGVVPVGMPRDDWGGNAQGSTPWKDAALATLGAQLGSDRAPVQYSEADGVNFNAIAKLAPEVILAAYSGLTREEYDKLSKIAPVVAYPELAYGTPWQQATTMIGEALGLSAEAERLVSRTEQQIKDAAARHPELQGKTFIYGNLEPATGGVNIYTATDNRPRFLSLLGMTQAPVVAKNSKGSAFFFPWSAERADELASDIFVTWVPDGKTAEQIRSDKLLGQIPAVADRALVAESDNTLTLAVSAANPLSLPWALDAFLPKLAGAAAEVD